VSATMAEVALVMFIGMGPVKVLVFYLGAIRDAEPALGRRVAVRAVATAAIVTLGLVLSGTLLMRLFHFSNGSLIVAGGIVLLAYGLQMVLSTVPGNPVEAAPTEAALMRLAINPMGVPLILNPAGIAAAIILSAEATSLGELAYLATIIVLLAVLDIVVLVVARPLGARLPVQATIVLEKVLGVLLAAVAVELIVLGLLELGIIDQLARA
jgi:small neutral amino acid transporter SnatA (MarC family)